MARVVDVLSIVLLFAAVAAFCCGVLAIADQQDLPALYWLVLGAVLLRAATDLLRPAGAR